MNTGETKGRAREIEGEAEAQVGNVTDGPGTQAIGSEDQVAAKIGQTAGETKDTTRLTVDADSCGR